MSNKTRLDVLLVEQGLLESRQKAQAVIMAGSVFVDGQRVDKPGTAVPNTAAIQVRGHALPYVSRGGLKLEKAMAAFPIDLNGAVCADIGASTGGFTDCMLQNGAKKVYACASHGVLSGPALERLEASCIEELALLDTIPAPVGEAELAKARIKYLTVAPMFAEAIERTYQEISIAKLFH